MEKQNILQNESIPRLIMKMSLPMMASMLIQALYNIVDSIFVSHYSQDALAAVSLAFPLQNLMIAFAIGTSIGASAIISRRFGEKRDTEANKIANVSMFLAICNSLLFAFIGLFLLKPYFSFFTNDTLLLKQSISYTKICLMLSFGIFITLNTEKIIQATGDSMRPMIIQMSGAIINIILDPILIFTFNMGVQGAAIATVFGQICSMILAFYYISKNKYFNINIKEMKPEMRYIKDIYQVGIPTIIMNSVGTVMVSWMNAILISFTTIAVNVFGIYFKIQSFLFLPLFGLNTGILPILGYNYGARNKERMIHTLKFAIKIGISVMVVGTLIFQLFPDSLLHLFKATDEMLVIGTAALKTISLCFIPASISILIICTFQATGYGFFSMIVSILRQLIILCPSAMILASLFGLNSIWYSFLIAEVCSLCFTIIMFTYVYKKKIKNL